MKRKVAVSLTTFAKHDKKPLEILESSGCEVKLNPHGRKVTKDEVISLAKGARGLIAGTENLKADVLNKLKDLKVISRCGAGIDNIDTKAAEALGIKIFYTPDGPTLAVAELVIGLMLDLLRHISLSNNEMKSGTWKKRMGNLFMDKNIGIVGLGKIGKTVARLCKSLGANISYTDPVVENSEYNLIQLDELLKTSDIVTIHTPAGKENTNMISEKEFSMMKKGAYFINCSRGGVVDEEALYSALKGKKIAGAAIDVFEKEPYEGKLKELDNIILTPHTGSYAKEARVEMEIDAVNNLIEGFKNI